MIIAERSDILPIDVTSNSISGTYAIKHLQDISVVAASPSFRAISQSECHGSLNKAIFVLLDIQTGWVEARCDELNIIEGGPTLDDAIREFMEFFDEELEIMRAADLRGLAPDARALREAYLKY